MVALQSYFENNPLVSDDGVFFATKPSKSACVVETKYFIWAEEEEELVLVNKFKKK